MIYEDIIDGIFIERPNRFIAKVLVNGKMETVHVKNTGRCKELLIEGTKVFLQMAKNPNRKTNFSLISVYKDKTLINMDSQCPNQVVFEALKNAQIPNIQNITSLKREVAFGNSRFDIYFETEDNKGFIEVKGVTLENDGIAMFPDAPTTRGTKHLNELISIKKTGVLAYVFFLIQIDGIRMFKPNIQRDPDFSDALLKASKSGVEILVYNSHITKNSITLGSLVDIEL